MEATTNRMMESKMLEHTRKPKLTTVLRKSFSDLRIIETSRGGGFSGIFNGKHLHFSKN